MVSEIRVKRVYEGSEPDDGTRILVDRLWPRGVSRDAFPDGSWLPALAPSTELRQWYDHDQNRFEEFVRRYRKELVNNSVASDLAATEGRLTLITATKDVEHSNAAVLAEFLREASSTR